MGQVLASDYVELYTLPDKDSQIDKSKINVVPKPIPPPKPKPGNVRFVNMEKIKAMQIYISQPIQNEFPDLTPEAYEGHQIADGHYYGMMPGGKRQGDGVLVLKSKPNQGGNVLMQDDHQYNYFGTYKDGQANGQGFAIFANDSACWGDVKQNQYNGQAILKTAENNTYYGQWEDRKLKVGHALTQHYYHVGSFKDGMREGIGESQYHDGTIIKGIWKKDSLDMFAKIIFPDGSEFSGRFLEGVKQGFGCLKTKDYEFYGEYDNNVKNGLGVLCETHDSGNQFEKKVKITESHYVCGVQQGLFCVTENGKKEWFYKNENQTIEPLVHITEQKTLAELYGQESLENQKLLLERELKGILTKIDETVKDCEKFMILQKNLDNQTQKLAQLTVYWDWIQECQQRP